MKVDPLLLVLLCGHLLGDFILQGDELSDRKARHTGWLIVHVLMVSAATWLLLGNIDAWRVAGIIFAIHLILDFAKIRLENRKPGFHIFALDQALHIAAITILWLYLRNSGQAAVMANQWTELWGLHYTKGLLLLSGLAACVWGAGVALKHQMASFAAELSETAKQGLPKGGKVVGMLERLLVFTFVLGGKPEGAGFIVAAKSVFRIGQLTQKEDRDLAEYILIGTLRSIAYALVIAFSTRWLIANIQ